MEMGFAVAVIGAGYGDEGKGLATATLTNMLGAEVVVRCNGGAQAGHTVVHGDKRHVFGHVGSGTFIGADTYLASNFIINSVILKKELAELEKLGHTPNILASRDCRVTTIFDMAINSLAELERADSRHGSCGMGINETVTRHRAGYFLTLGMLIENSVTELNETMKRIVEEWVPRRLKDHGITSSSFAHRSMEVQEKAGLYFSMFNIDRINLINEMVNSLSTTVSIDDMKMRLQIGDSIVVEGAQGLFIDEYLGEFPHVTRSITGLASHVIAAAECGITKVLPLYVTRAYATRHGAGPLDNEGVHITDKTLVDETNIENPWQGKLRYAPLNLDRLQDLINLDYARGGTVAMSTGTEVGMPLLMITCLDQLGDMVNVFHNDRIQQVPKDKFVEYVSNALNITVGLKSEGPDIANVSVLSALVQVP